MYLEQLQNAGRNNMQCVVCFPTHTLLFFSERAVPNIVVIRIGLAETFVSWTQNVGT